MMPVEGFEEEIVDDGIPLKEPYHRFTNGQTLVMKYRGYALSYWYDYWSYKKCGYAFWGDLPKDQGAFNIFVEKTEDTVKMQNDITEVFLKFQKRVDKIVSEYESEHKIYNCILDVAKQSIKQSVKITDVFTTR